MGGSHWTVLTVVGTRPNIMKTAPVLAELARRSDRFTSVLVHTGQHYDDAMSAIFFDELTVRRPDHFLDVGSGSHAQQTARVMERLEPILEQIRPDLVLVPGDVNSTLAAALTAAKLEIPVAHLEAGLRSFDRSMPEELNRVLTDAVASVHLIHSPEAKDNLLHEGIRESAIHAVGNTMIDPLLTLRDRPEVREAAVRRGLTNRGYLLVTLHRPALVDSPLLNEAFVQLTRISEEIPIVFPVHPRTKIRLGDTVVVGAFPSLHLLPPVGYLEFLGLMANAQGVLTDSGGVQEETTILGIPCFTLRDNTERPVTVELGTNTVLGLAPERIAEIPQLLARSVPIPQRAPPLWDGRAAQRVVDVIDAFLDARLSQPNRQLSPDLRRSLPEQSG